MKPVLKTRWSVMPDFSKHADTALVSELFSSLQGEGPHMGQRHLFIRFSGCDVDCSYCDENTKPGRRMSFTEILTEVEQLEKAEGPHSFVSLTGGEPLIQSDFLKKFLPELRSRHFGILLETNGVRWKDLREIIGLCDVIAMDLKLVSVGHHQDFLEEHGKFLRIASAKECYIKMIISKELDRGEFERACKMIKEITPVVPIFIQPIWGDRAELNDLLTELILKAKKQHQDVRLGIQLHKMLNMR